MSRVLFVLALVLAGCPKPQPLPPPGPPDADYVGVNDCAESTPRPQSPDVCGVSSAVIARTDGSVDQVRCVRCQVEVGCLYRPALVYCVVTCFDPSCEPESVRRAK